MLHKFDVKISVIPNGLEKYMAFFVGKNLVLIDSMQFMNSSLDKLVKKLSAEYFKYLVKEFCSKILNILKQKGGYSYEYMNSFERFNEDKLPAKNISLVQQKKEKLMIIIIIIKKYQMIKYQD